MATLGKIFKARKQILEGLVNRAIKNEFVEMVSAQRMEVCQKCEYFDGKCSVPGTGPCCGACGCSLAVKTRSLATVCGKVEKDEDPLWFPIMKNAEVESMNRKIAVDEHNAKKDQTK